MSVEISNTRYLVSHGKPPRGSGLWMFETVTGRIFCQFNGKFSDAKKEAQAVAASRGLPAHTTLYTCP